MDYWTGTGFEKIAQDYWHEQHDRIALHAPGRVKASREAASKRSKMASNILLMKFSERAAQVSYVTSQLLQEHPNLLSAVANKMLHDWRGMKEPPMSQYIADFSFVITKLPEGDLKTDCVKAYKTLIPR